MYSPSLKAYQNVCCGEESFTSTYHPSHAMRRHTSESHLRRVVFRSWVGIHLPQLLPNCAASVLIMWHTISPLAGRYLPTRNSQRWVGASLLAAVTCPLATQLSDSQGMVLSHHWQQGFLPMGRRWLSMCVICVCVGHGRGGRARPP